MVGEPLSSFLPLYGLRFEMRDKSSGEFSEFRQKLGKADARFVVRTFHKVADRPYEDLLKVPFVKHIKGVLFELKPTPQIRVPICFQRGDEAVINVLGAFRKKRAAWTNEQLEGYLAFALDACCSQVDKKG